MNARCVLLSMSARNWRPNSLSWTHCPSAVIHSPALTEAREPTMATRSRCPFAFTLSTAQPFSSLKKVTRSISPERLSAGRRVMFSNARSATQVTRLGIV